MINKSVNRNPNGRRLEPDSVGFGSVGYTRRQRLSVRNSESFVNTGAIEDVSIHNSVKTIFNFDRFFGLISGCISSFQNFWS
ncbi:hypothetical protein ACET3Z_027092 [Daucus carota]